MTKYLSTVSSAIYFSMPPVYNNNIEERSIILIVILETTVSSKTKGCKYNLN